MKRFFTIVFIIIFAFNVEIFACDICNDYNSSNDVSIEKKRDFIKYKAKKGDSISSILKKFQLSLSDFLTANPSIKAKATINYGDKVLIPRSGVGLTNNATIDLQVKQFVQQRNFVVATPFLNEKANYTIVGPLETDEIDVHTVLKGQTIYSISKMYNVEIDVLLDANPIIREVGLKLGSIIRIPYFQKRVESESIEEQLRSSDCVAVGSLIMGTMVELDSTVVEVAIIMPVNGNIDPLEDGFVDLYRGFLIAAEEVKSNGLSVNIDFFGVGRDSLKVEELIASGKLDNKEIIVGPIFDEQFTAVAKYAERLGITIINPLMASNYDARNIIDVLPERSGYWDKLKDSTFNKNVIYFATENDDSVFLQNFQNEVGLINDTLVYDKHVSPEKMLESFSAKKENLVLIAANDLLNIELLVSKLTAVVAFGYKKIEVLGTSKMSNIEPEKRGEYFKVNTSYITSSFQDRTNPESMQFEADYISTYLTNPTRFSYRGYEVGVLFLNAYKEHGIDFINKIGNTDKMVLQAPFHFSRETPNSILTNKSWIKVTYNPDYSITVK